MRTIPCPGCHTELGPEITACPICTRPRTKYEISRAYAALRAQDEKRRKRPIIAAKIALVLGAVGAAVHYFQVPIRGAVADGVARVNRFVDDARDPGRVAARSNPSPAPVPQAPPPPPAPDPFAASRSAPSPISPAVRMETPRPLAPVQIPVRRKRAEGDLPMPALEATEWVLRGAVYDLITLRPVANAKFSIRHNEHLDASFQTDEDGRYLVVLERVTDGGYELFNTASAYVPAVYSESDVPYGQLTVAERKDMAETARAGDVHPTPIPDITGETAIHRDLYVVRRR